MRLAINFQRLKIHPQVETKIRYFVAYQLIFICQPSTARAAQVYRLTTPTELRTELITFAKHGQWKVVWRCRAREQRLQLRVTWSSRKRFRDCALRPTNNRQRSGVISTQPVDEYLTVKYSSTEFDALLRMKCLLIVFSKFSLSRTPIVAVHLIGRAYSRSKAAMFHFDNKGFL